MPSIHMNGEWHRILSLLSWANNLVARSLPSHAHAMALSEDGVTLCIGGKDGVKVPSPLTTRRLAHISLLRFAFAGGQSGDRGMRAHPRRPHLRRQRRLPRRLHPLQRRRRQVSPTLFVPRPLLGSNFDNTRRCSPLEALPDSRLPGLACILGAPTGSTSRRGMCRPGS